MATLIRVDGSEKQVSPQNGRNFTTDELQSYVGGWLDLLKLPSGDCLWLDEEGKMKGKPRNGRATTLGHACGIARSDFVVGDVLVTSETAISHDEEES